MKIRPIVNIETKFPGYLVPAMKRAAICTGELLPKKALSKATLEASQCEVGISVVGIRKIRKLNAQYRKKDRPTDVLSFPLLDSPFPGPVCSLGDVVLCWEVARAQRARFGTTCRSEIERLVVHGMLHLLGYDHETSATEAAKMKRLENRILSHL